MSVTCPVCESVLAPDPRDPKGCELRQMNADALRSFVERSIRDDAEHMTDDGWETWVNALPFEEFVEFIAHDWNVEPMPSLIVRLGLNSPEAQLGEDE